MSFIDDHTRKVWVYFMKHKGEVFQHFLNFKAMVEKEKGVSIKCLRSDGGGEYFSNELSEYLKEHGIQRKYSCSYSPQHNGVVEWKNMHIVEMACAMLNEKNLPNYFWAEAVATAVYIMNRTPTTAVHGMTPENKFTGKKLDVSHFRVFGCIAYMHVPEEKRSKLDPKADKCIFIGYSSKQKGYRCFNPSTRKLQVSRDVVFDEMVSWYSPLKVGEDGEAKKW
jgi:transposase InsO family protein